MALQRPTLIPSPTDGPPRPPLTPGPETGADRPASLCLRLLAQPNSAIQAGEIATYQLITENRGRGRARRVGLTFPFAPAALTLLDVTFSRPAAWVSELGLGAAKLELGDLEAGAHVTATLRLRVHPHLPLGHSFTTRASLSRDGQAAGQIDRSNRSTLVIAEAAVSITTVPLTIVPATGTLATTFTATYTGFAAHEHIARWYHDPSGQVLALEPVQADANGNVTFHLAAPSLRPGRSLLVASGQCSQVTAIGTLTVAER